MNSIFIYNIGIFDKIIQQQKFLANIKLINNISKLYGYFYDKYNNYWQSELILTTNISNYELNMHLTTE